MIELGFCQCGCGARTALAKKSDRRVGVVQGVPYRYLIGHHRRKPGPRYAVDDNTGCWNWLLGKDDSGYGLLRINNKNVRAHRLFWEEMVGPIPPGLCVLHKCDNPPCVNPAHLFLGTKGDNNTDRHRKGRTKGWVVTRWAHRRNGNDANA